MKTKRIFYKLPKRRKKVFSNTTWIRKQNSFWFPSSNREIKKSIKHYKILKDKGPWTDAVPVPALLSIFCSWGHLFLSIEIFLLWLISESWSKGTEKCEAKKFKDLSAHISAAFQYLVHPTVLTPALLQTPWSFRYSNMAISLILSNLPPNTQHSLSNSHSSHRSHTTWLLIKETFVHTLLLHLSLLNY